jgi:CheY-like chemotaxis protein
MREILLVDDDLELREALQAALAAHGHVVFGAGDGIAALRAAVETRPDVIISDVSMPLLEGPDAVRILKALPMFRRVPVILMSGAELSATHLADAAVRKPVTTERLVELIEDVIWSTASPGAPSRGMPMRTTVRDEGWDPTLAIASLGQPPIQNASSGFAGALSLCTSRRFEPGDCGDLA